MPSSAVPRVVRSADDALVRAVLSPVRDAPTATFLVRLGRASARRAGIAYRAGHVLGGVAQMSCGWAVVAYTDRTHLLDGGGPVTFLDDATDLPNAVASLITHWQRAGRHPITRNRKKACP